MLMAAFSAPAAWTGDMSLGSDKRGLSEVMRGLDWQRHRQMKTELRQQGKNLRHCPRIHMCDSFSLSIKATFHAQRN
jgi:hypothetical protein